MYAFEAKYSHRANKDNELCLGAISSSSKQNNLYEIYNLHPLRSPFSHNCKALRCAMIKKVIKNKIDKNLNVLKTTILASQDTVQQITFL